MHHRSPRLKSGPASGTLPYGAGTPATVRVQTDNGRSRMRAFMGANVRQIEGDAAPLDSEAFGTRVDKFAVLAPKKLQQRIDASATMIAKANLRVCFDRTGKADRVTILDVGPDVPEFATLAEMTARSSEGGVNPPDYVATPTVRYLFGRAIIPFELLAMPPSRS